MISLVTGQPGSGKSFYAMRALVAALDKGKYVAMNVDLEEDWPARIAHLNPVRRVVPGRRAAVARRISSRVVVTHDLDELMRYRLPGKGEGRGVMVMDEAHNWLNSRNWQADDRGKIVRFFTQHRKLGWDIYLISQFEDAIDKQVKTLFEYRIQLRNLKRLKVLGMNILPVNLFLAIWTWNGVMSKQIVKREVYGLNRGVASLYDTMATSFGLDEAAESAGLLYWPGHEPTGHGSDQLRAQTQTRTHAARRAPAPEAAHVLERIAAVSDARPVRVGGPRPGWHFDPATGLEVPGSVPDWADPELQALQSWVSG